MFKSKKDFLKITVSILISAVGIYFFKFANNFSFGGITGLAVLIAKTGLISASDFSFIANILLLLAHLQNSNESTKKEDTIIQSTFDNILSYIDKNPDKPLTLGTLSKIFFLSESRISHLFKSKLNISAMQYINRKKISYAHSLLIAGLPPVQVAEKCGFENYSTFYRLYKSSFGVTPKNYNKYQ